MKVEEQEINPYEITEVSGPDDLSPELLEQYDRAVQAATEAVDDFISKHPEYKETDENRQVILDYLEAHDLAISPASLELCCEQLRDRLDLETEKESNRVDEASRIRQASTAQLATPDTEDVLEPTEESPKEIEDESASGKPVAWRNGRRVGVAA